MAAIYVPSWWYLAGPTSRGGVTSRKEPIFSTSHLDVSAVAVDFSGDYTWIYLSILDLTLLLLEMFYSVRIRKTGASNQYKKLCIWGSGESLTSSIHCVWSSQSISVIGFVCESQSYEIQLLATASGDDGQQLKRMLTELRQHMLSARDLAQQRGNAAKPGWRGGILGDWNKPLTPCAGKTPWILCLVQ